MKLIILFNCQGGPIRTTELHMCYATWHSQENSSWPVLLTNVDTTKRIPLNAIFLAVGAQLWICWEKNQLSEVLSQILALNLS